MKSRKYQSGFLNFLGPAVSSVLGYQGQKETNKTNIKLGREQMAFQERMSSTAYQRAVGDMQAAGLNPMLAYSQGGASSPVGSMPQVQNAAAAGVNSAASGMALAQGVQQINQSKAQADLLAAQAAKVRSETMGLDLNTAMLQASIKDREYGGELKRRQGVTELVRLPYIDAQTDLTRAREASVRLGYDLSKETFSADVARRKAASLLTEMEVPRSKSEAQFWDKAEDLPQWLKMALQILNGLSGARAANR